MPCTVIVGAQWGDEGKGKIVDTLAERADVVARYQGGNNAGHTLVLGEETYTLRLRDRSRGADGGAGRPRVARR